eukprot:jgi/Mesen1/4899/ME000244S04080
MAESAAAQEKVIDTEESDRPTAKDSEKPTAEIFEQPTEEVDKVENKEEETVADIASEGSYASAAEESETESEEGEVFVRRRREASDDEGEEEEDKDVKEGTSDRKEEGDESVYSDEEDDSAGAAPEDADSAEKFVDSSKVVPDRGVVEIEGVDEGPVEGEGQAEEAVGDEEGEGKAGEEEGKEHVEGADEEEKKAVEPFVVPTSGAFYMHDDRFSEAGAGRPRGGKGGRKLWGSRDEKPWSHDMFEKLNLADMTGPSADDDDEEYGMRRGRGRGGARRGRGPTVWEAAQQRPARGGMGRSRGSRSRAAYMDQAPLPQEVPAYDNSYDASDSLHAGASNGVRRAGGAQAPSRPAGRSYLKTAAAQRPASQGTLQAPIGQEPAGSGAGAEAGAQDNYTPSLGPGSGSDDAAGMPGTGGGLGADQAGRGIRGGRSNRGARVTRGGYTQKGAYRAVGAVDGTGASSPLPASGGQQQLLQQQPIDASPVGSSPSTGGSVGRGTGGTRGGYRGGPRLPAAGSTSNATHRPGAPSNRQDANAPLLPPPGAQTPLQGGSVGGAPAGDLEGILGKGAGQKAGAGYQSSSSSSSKPLGTNAPAYVPYNNGGGSPAGSSSGMRVSAPDYSPQQVSVGGGMQYRQQQPPQTPSSMGMPGVGVGLPQYAGQPHQYAYGNGEVAWVPVQLASGGVTYGQPYMMDGPPPPPAYYAPGPPMALPYPHQGGDANSNQKQGGLWKPPPHAPGTLS